MGFKFYMPIVSIILSKLAKDLIEGREVSVSCHLLFHDGYAPLLLKPSLLYATYANAVISTLKPEAYLVVENNVPDVHAASREVGVNWLSAALVTQKNKTYSVGRRYTIENGRVSFLDADLSQLPQPYDVSMKLKGFYNELPEEETTHPNFIKLISSVSSFVKITKAPYSKKIKNSLH